MASTDKELEQQLTEAGNKLVTPPDSVDELLPLLDQVENCLSKVEQSPAKSMQNALAPSLEALVADQLFGHSDTDVKVAVASCISEITRITAPDAPYDDDRMKDVFQLIVSSFENLADNSSRSYGKRTSILETVAKVRSCVVMLDLECDGLIIEMFQHFLKAIRDYHPDNVFSSMETIMTLVLEESEDISIELLSPLVESVKKGNEEVPPVARKLGEKVLESCATKVKPYLIVAVKSLNISLNDYSEVVSSICEVAASNAEQNDAHLADDKKVEEGKPDQVTLDEAVQADKELTTKASSPKPAEIANDTSPKSVVSNGITQTGEDDSLADSSSLKKEEHANHTNQSKSIDTSNNDAQCIMDTEKPINVESKPDLSVKQRGRKVNSSVKSAEPSESSHIDVEEKADELPDDKNHEKEVPPPLEVPSEELAAPSEKQKESEPSSPKGLVDESMTVASPSASDESLSKKAGQSKKKDDLVRDSAPSAEVAPKKTSGGTSDSSAKLNKRSSRKASDGTKEDKTRPTIDESKKEGDTTSESDGKQLKHGKQLKQSSKKVDGKSKDGDGLPTKKPEDKKRQSRGKAISEKNVAKSSTKDDIKEKPPSSKSATKSTKDAEETPVTSNKRKRSSLGKEKASEDGDELVGLKIKVWWPLDRKFYEGVVESFDAVKMKHKVLYTDGETEDLDLGVETWESVKTDPKADEIEAADYPSPASSSDMPLKKRVKSNIGQLTKQGKKDASPKRGGSASSRRSRSAATKYGRNTKEVVKDSKSVDDSKAAKKVEDKSGGKAKDQTSKSGGKSAGTATKAASKSKTDDAVTSKTGKSREDAVDTPKGSKFKQETPKSGKSKVETPKTSPGVKGKPPKSGGRSNINGSGKLKSDSSKGKEMEDKDSSTESDELAESTKKKASTSKGQASAVRSGKKRRRA